MKGVHAECAPTTSAATDGVQPPVGVSAEAATGALTWQAGQGATAYLVYRAPAPAGPYQQVGRVAASATTFTFRDSNAPAGVSYYRVQSAVTCTAAGQRACDSQTAPPHPA